MGQLRARQLPEKARRRAEVLRHAAALWRKRSFADFKMSDLAAASGLAKGTLYLYFETKEELFLVLLEDRLYLWMAAVAVFLRKAKGPAAVARKFREAFQADPQLHALLPLLESVLEHGIAKPAALAFKQRLLANMLPLAAAIEAALPDVPRGAGGEILIAIRALHTGYSQMAAGAPAVRQVLDENPELACLRVEFAVGFEMALRRLLKGYSTTK